MRVPRAYIKERALDTSSCGCYGKSAILDCYLWSPKLLTLVYYCQPDLDLSSFYYRCTQIQYTNLFGNIVCKYVQITASHQCDAWLQH